MFRVPGGQQDSVLLVQLQVRMGGAQRQADMAEKHLQETRLLQEQLLRESPFAQRRRLVFGGTLGRPRAGQVKDARPKLLLEEGLQLPVHRGRISA